MQQKRRQGMYLLQMPPFGTFANTSLLFKQKLWEQTNCGSESGDKSG